jgi:hypothetical protein
LIYGSLFNAERRGGGDPSVLINLLKARTATILSLGRSDDVSSSAGATRTGVSLAYIHSERYNFVRGTIMRRLYADQPVIVTAILIALLSALFAVLQAR